MAAKTNRWTPRLIASGRKAVGTRNVFGKKKFTH
jgi:hypothetical protein